MGVLLISRVSLGFSEAQLASYVILGMWQRLVLKLEVLSCGRGHINKDFKQLEPQVLFLALRRLFVCLVM